MVRSLRVSLVTVLAALALAPALVSAQPRRPTPAPAPALTEEQAKAIAAQAAAEAVAAERARVQAEADAKAAADAAALAATQVDLRAYADQAAAKAVADRAEADKLAAANAAANAKVEVKVGADAPPPSAGDGDYLRGRDGFTDVRLNFTLTNENILAKPGETIPSVPGWRLGRPNSLGTLFFDNYDTRFSGYETMSNAIMYRNFRKDHAELEGGLVLRLNEFGPNNIAISDAGSYLVASYWKDPEHKDPTRYSLTVFPVSADRFRLGYSYRLSWGGNDEYRLTVPQYQERGGLKLQYDTDKAYAFVGAKTATVLDADTSEARAVFGFLAGAGYDLSPMVRAEINGGIFDRGSNQLEDVKSEEVYLYGASVQLSAHKGMPVQSSIDYKLYKYDPERIGRVFQKAKYPGGTSWLVMGEATYLGQTLKDPEKSGSTKVQSGFAGDVNVRAMVDRMRLRVDLQYRDLAFILHSVPSLPTYSDFPTIYDRTPNFFAAAGVDKNYDGKLTLGLIVGVELPATLTSPVGIPGSLTETGKSTAVIRNNGGQTLINVLPAGEKAAPAYAFKASGQYDLGEIFAFLVDVYFSYDPNQTRLRRDNPEDVFQYEFGEFNQLGTNVTFQAKF